MISFEVKSDNKVQMYLKQLDMYMKNKKYIPLLESAGKKGIEALKQYTPKDTGLTADSWTYDIVFNGDGVSIFWKNSNVVDGWFNIALALQFGHGTGRGGYVEGVDYINPALRPVFDELSLALWKEVNL